jgi:serine/threonine protein phosphatase PrpC
LFEKVKPDLTMNKIKYISFSQKGIKRDRNQDSIFVKENDNISLFILFDGVSSNPSSHLFVEKFKKILLLKYNLINRDGGNLSKLLFQVHSETLSSNIDGYSTMSAVCINRSENVLSFVNIGDSRIYIYTNQFIEKVSTDNSLVNNKNILTKYLGDSTLSKKDFDIKRIKFESHLLICSDGFYKVMEQNLKEFFRILNFDRFNNIKNSFESVLKNQNDDTTYIIIKK